MDKIIFENSFRQARLKVNRAVMHINETISYYNNISASGCCKLIEYIDPETGAQRISAIADLVPAQMVLAIGDAFHCLSSSLEYVATGLIRAKTGNVNRVSFPTNESRKALRDSFKRPKQGKTPTATRRFLEAFPLVALDLLTVIKAYQGGNYWVWEVRKADNIDKHNMIIPIVTINSVTVYNLVDEVCNSRIGALTMQVDAGNVVHGLSYHAGGSRLKFDEEVDFECEMNFPKDAEVFAGNPVIPTLIDAASLVDAAINRIEATARRYL